MNATHDNVIIESEDLEVSTLYIPDQKSFQEAKGKVISVGPDCKEDIKPGDTVLFNRGEGRPVDKYLVVNERHLLAKVV